MNDFPPVPLSYWLRPANWRNEAAFWLNDHGWRDYCWIHDVIHWSWTHRNCCRDNHRFVAAKYQELLKIIEGMEK